MKFFTSVILCILSFSVITSQIPHPKDEFGFTPGDDHKLADYKQLKDYYFKLAESSPRVMITEIGQSVLGEPLLLLYISSAKNLKNLAKYKKISSELANAQIDPTVAKMHIEDGKSIVWIDAGLHATEVACAQMAPLLAHRVVTEETEEMKDIRENTIMLLMPVMNPDGLDIVVDWYKQHLGTEYETSRPPWLYHIYVGHDNNRDWFMNNMPESEAVTRVLYNEWYPQIVYNHHQSAPSWTRIFIPPFASPVNPNIHPGVTTGVNIVGSAMANRYAMKNMPGAVSGVTYSMWWNGGMRTVPYFHNMIGILTETAHATATPREYDIKKKPAHVGGRRGDGHPTDGTSIFYPLPWKGGESTFSQPVRYMIEASIAVLKNASDLRKDWLGNIYKMGLQAIESGRKEGPYAYIFPSKQANKGEDLNLLRILSLGGIRIERSKEDFQTHMGSFKKGDHIIFTSQAFRPYILDLLEKQQYPKRMKNGKPETPYDLAGWTLPLQMGIEMIRVDTQFQVTTEKLEIIEEKVSVKTGKTGYSVSSSSNASYHLANLALNSGKKVWSQSDTSTNSSKIIIEGKLSIEEEYVIKKNGIQIAGIKSAKSEWKELSKPKIGLYKSWVANMDEGWTRWILESYNFNFDTLHDSDIINGDLTNYDCIILPNQAASTMLHGHSKMRMPIKYCGGLGLKGSLALTNYVSDGGTIIAFDDANEFLIDQFNLPIKSTTRNVSTSSFTVPGSLVKIEIDQKHPLAIGMPAHTAAYFVNSSAFELNKPNNTGEGGTTKVKQAESPKAEIISSYAKKDLLLSGFAQGESKYLAGKIAALSMSHEKGKLIMFGFRPQFRGQPRGTYKLFFNALMNSTQ